MQCPRAKKLPHRNFAINEWIANIVGKKDYFIDAAGTVFLKKDFWKNRTSLHWENNWEVFEEPEPLTLSKEHVIEFLSWYDKLLPPSKCKMYMGHIIPRTYSELIDEWVRDKAAKLEAIKNQYT